MTGVLYLPQATLDVWLEAGHVDLGTETLIFTADQATFPVVSAVWFKNLIEGEDQQKLLGKVRAVEALRMGGAEVSMGTVVLADTAYEVDDGFMVSVPLPSAAARPQSKAAPQVSGQEADLLAQFILGKLS